MAVKRLFTVLSVGLIIAPNCSAGFIATAYTLDECGKPPWHEAYGITASGEYVREGFIAVDTNVIPMHSVVYLSGIGEYDGFYIAKDTGGAVNGRHVDIYMKDKKDALKFGRRNVKVVILGRGNTVMRKFILDKGVKCPRRGTSLSAGYDFFLKDDVCIKAHSLEMVPSGVRVEMPDYNVMLMFARSSLCKKGLLLANSVGVIDADYKDEIMFPLYNLTDKDVWLKAGERVVQGVFSRYYIVNSDEPVPVQRVGGLGSTGK